MLYSPMKYFLNPELYAVKEATGEYVLTGIPGLDDTPQILTWQDIDWPKINADFGVYVAPAGQGELSDLADNGNGQEFLEAWVSEDSGVDVQTIWESLKPGYITEGEVADTNWPALIHVFRSVEGKDYHLIWDIL